MCKYSRLWGGNYGELKRVSTFSHQRFSALDFLWVVFWFFWLDREKNKGRVQSMFQKSADPNVVRAVRRGFLVRGNFKGSAAFLPDKSQSHSNVGHYKAMAALHSWKDGLFVPLFSSSGQLSEIRAVLPSSIWPWLVRTASQSNHTWVLLQRGSKYWICAPPGRQSNTSMWKLPRMCAGGELQLPLCILQILQHAAAVDAPFRPSAAFSVWKKLLALIWLFSHPLWCCTGHRALECVWDLVHQETRDFSLETKTNTSEIASNCKDLVETAFECNILWRL